MDIKELHSFKLSDAVKFHDKLNPKLWVDNKLDPKVRNHLLDVAEDFISELGIKDVNVEDVTVSGSNAAYSYTPHSDLDLHIVVDMSKLPDNEVYQELFKAKKTLYNDAHDITVHGVPVEVYVQDSNLPVVSLGEYSILHDRWIKHPIKRRANFDQNATRAKYEKLADLVGLTMKTKDLKRVDDVLKLIKRYRQAGLSKGGEFSPENLAYKAIRTQGGIDKLYDLSDRLHSQALSIEEAGTRDDALLKIKKLQNTTGRTPSEIESITRIIEKMMKQYNIKPEEIGRHQPVDPFKAKLAKAAYEKQMAAAAMKGEWERFKRGIFAEESIYGRADDDESEVVHHVTPHKFSEFNPLSHFGTKKAAGARAFALATDYEYGKPKKDNVFNALATRLRLGNVVDIDDTNTHTAWDIAKSLCRRNIISKEDRDVVPKEPGPAADKILLNILKVYAIDTLRYTNDIEDPGSTSYIITDPSQVRILKRSNNAKINFEKYRKYNSDAYWSQDDLLESYTTKQQVIDHFVRAAKYRGEDVNLAARKGAAAWERGWRGPKPKKPAEIKPYDPERYKNVRLPYIDESAEQDIMYHVTPTKNLRSIMKNGLRPRVGDRSVKLHGEENGIFLFPTLDDVEDAVSNWLGDEFDEDEDLTLLAIDVSGLPLVDSNAGYEKIAKTAISPDRISVSNELMLEASGYIPSAKEKNGHLPFIAEYAKDEEPIQPRKEHPITVYIHSILHNKTIALIGEKLDQAHGKVKVEFTVPNSGEKRTIWMPVTDKKYPTGKLSNSVYLREKHNNVVTDGIFEYWAYEPNLTEASGYIPSAKEKNDPRFKTALTVDVKPDSIKDNAKRLGSKVSRAGIPPQANPNGKIAENLMKEWQSFLAEDQQELFPGYDAQHREKRLGDWLQNTHAWDGHKPMTFYHATTKDFDTFNTHGTGFASALGMAFEVERHGSFFAVDPMFAESFIEKPDYPGEYKEGGRVIPVHLSVQNPIDLRDNNLSYMLRDEDTVEGFKANDIDLRSIYYHVPEFDRWELFDGPEGAEFVDNLQKLGFDGAIINESIPNNSNAKSGEVWVVFNPNQVKSIHNRGSFNPDDPSLMRENG